MKRHWHKAFKVAHFGFPQPPARKADGPPRRLDSRSLLQQIKPLTRKFGQRKYPIQKTQISLILGGDLHALVTLNIWHYRL
jgi:hypothetical protein